MPKKREMLKPDKYMEYFERYLLNRNIFIHNDPKVCINCSKGNMNITETKTTITLNCNSKQCEHWELTLPTYNHIDEYLEEIKNSDDPESLKQKNIDKLIEKYIEINEVKKNRTRLNELLTDYRDLSIDTTDPNNLAQFNKELIDIKKEIVSILDKPKYYYVPGSVKPKLKNL